MNHTCPNCGTNCNTTQDDHAIYVFCPECHWNEVVYKTYAPGTAMAACIAWLEDESSDQSSPVWNEGV
jgi:hypothetical protein